MTDPILALLAVTALALMALGAAGAWFGPRARQGLGLAGACLAGLGATMSLVWLLLEATPIRLAVPIGLPGQSFALALDPLAAFFLVPVFVAGGAVIAFAAETAKTQGEPLCALGALVLALLAGDAAGFAVALTLAGVALSVGRVLAPVLLGPVLLAAACVLAASAVAGSRDALGGIALDEPARAALALGLTLLGPVLLAGLVLRDDLPPGVAALTAGGLAPVSVHAVMRLLSGAAPPGWWAIPVLVVSALATLHGAWSAARHDRVDGIVIGLARRLVGLVGIGLGLAMAARSADLPDLAVLALGGAMLAVTAVALCGALGLLIAQGVQDAAGSLRLDRLGGLIQRMPVSSSAMLAALLGLLALPPSLGFAALWLLAQALLAAPPAAGGLTGWVVAGLFGVLAGSAVLAMAAGLRLFGVAFLGRARWPRSSAAEEVPAPARPVLMMLAGLSLLLGLLPGLVPRVLADPAILSMVGARVGDRTAVLTLTAALDAPGYAPLPLVLLIGLVAGVILLLRRSRVTAQERRAWADGFAPPPAWLPFGDPLTQTDGAGSVPDIVLPAIRVPPVPRVPRIGAAWVLLGAMAALVIAAAAWGVA